MRLKSIAMALLLVYPAVLDCAMAQADASDILKQGMSSIQQYSVLKGRVTDAKEGVGIPYATLHVKNYRIAVVSDVDGYYSINLPIGRDNELQVRSTGYKTKDLRIKESSIESTLNIGLEQDILGLDEVVVTGTRTEKTIANAPVLTHVISEFQLRQNDFANIMDALEYTIPGLQFNSDPRGDNIKIQGLENKYILILVDGERLSTTPGGPIDFERLSMSNVKQIEVVKGAASALYGSSAIGMTINIITKVPERKLEGWAKTRYSRFNDLTFDASIGSAYKDFTSQTLFYRNSQDGYNLHPETPQVYTKNPGKSMNIEQKLGWDNGNTKINASGILYFAEVDNPKESIKSTHYKSDNKTIRFGVDHKLGRQNTLKGSYYGDFYTRKTVFEKTKKSAKNASSDVQTLRLMDVYSPLDNLEAIFGGEFNWNKDFNNMQYGEDVQTRRVNDINGFIQGDWQIIPLVNLVGGFRFTHHSVFGNAYSPKVNLMVSPGNWRLRVGYSRGFKAPDATELYSDFMMGSVSHNIGNPNLKSEKSNYYYASVEYRYKNLSSSVDLYQNNVDNKIQSAYVQVQDDTGAHWTEMRYSNVDKVRIRGVEYSVDFYPIRQLMLHGSYAYTDAKDMNTRLQLIGNTRHAISCNITYKEEIFKRGFSLSIAGRWTSSKVNDTEEISEDPVTGEVTQTITHKPQSAFSMWKITALYTVWKKNHLQVDVSGGIQNIFNYTDPIRYTTYDAGRRAFGSAIFKF